MIVIGIVISGNEGLHRLNSSVNITCSSDLDVQNIQWLNLTNSRAEIGRIDEQSLTLTIRNVTSELNTAMYICEARVRLATGLTTIMQTITFNVESKSSKSQDHNYVFFCLLDELALRLPELVRTTSVTPSSITVQWTVMGPFNAERPEEFVVMYGLSSEALIYSTSVILASSGRQTYSTTLPSLQPGTLYYYRVEARNQFATRRSDVMMDTTDDTSEYCP